MGVREHLEAGLMERARVPRWWSLVAVRARRLLLAALLALAPALLLFVLVLLAPPEVLRALVEPQNVRDTFSRFVSGITTASSVAVSIAVLTLRRDLRGIRNDLAGQRANREYRQNVRAQVAKREIPILLGPFMERSLSGLAEKAQALRGMLDAQGARIASEGLTLAEHLEIVGRRSREQAAAMAAARRQPDHLLLAALDLETEVSARLAQRFARMDGLDDAMREGLRELGALLDEIALSQRFMKTLDIQWSLSRMCIVILVSTIPSTALAALMTLTYGPGVVAAFGWVWAAALVCATLALVLFPVACFVSYILRFLVINQHTLPAEGFLFGPEAKLLEG